MPATTEQLSVGDTGIASTNSINHSGYKDAVPEDPERLLGVGAGDRAVGRARVYYTSYPGVDVLEAVLAGLRSL
nr:hypothetical protein [Salinispora tropica]